MTRKARDLSDVKKFGGGGHESRNAGSPSKLKRARKQILPSKPSEGTRPATP